MTSANQGYLLTYLVPPIVAFHAARILMYYVVPSEALQPSPHAVQADDRRGNIHCIEGPDTSAELVDQRLLHTPLHWFRGLVKIVDACCDRLHSNGGEINMLHWTASPRGRLRRLRNIWSASWELLSYFPTLRY